MKSLAFSVCLRAPVRLAASTLAVLVAFPVLAQSQAAGTLGEVVVTATRVAVPVTDVIADVSMIDRSELELAGQSSLKDLLAQQPGVQIVSNGGYRSTTGVFLRGATSSQAIVLIDGVRVGSATSGVASFENMPLDRIERIEILRGAASALYGPDAVGGVIQIFTREPAEGLQLAADIGAGSNGQRQAGASIRGRSGAIGYSLGLSKEKASGISVSNNPASTSYNADEDSFDASSVDAKLTAQLSKQHALTLSLMHSEMDYQFDGRVSPVSSLITDAWSRPVLNTASLKWDAQWLDNWKSSLILASSDDESISDYYRTTTGALYSHSEFKTHRTQATWQNDIALGQDVATVLVENRVEAVDSSTNYSVKQREVNSVMVSYALNKSDWNALAVLRHDDNSQFGGFDNWALSGGYKLSPRWRFVASVGTSFQAPTFNQLYYPLTGTFQGDPTLTPQRNRASEMGLKYQHDTLSASATLYHNEIQGFIAPSTNIQSSLAVLRGVTLNLENQVGDTRYAVSYDYADPRSFSATSSLDNLRLVRVAQNVLNFNIHHRLGAVGVFGEFKLSSDREDSKVVGTGRDVLPGYGLLNAGATWKINKDLTLLARINNLTDTTYMLANGYAMPGRNAFVSLSWAM